MTAKQLCMPGLDFCQQKPVSAKHEDLTGLSQLKLV